MIKTLISATLFTAVFTLAPIGLAQAATAEMKLECNEASMTDMSTRMKDMSDEDVKKTSMEKMDMARKSMAAGKMDDCMMHMTEVQTLVRSHSGNKTP